MNQEQKHQQRSETTSVPTHPAVSVSETEIETDVHK